MAEAGFGIIHCIKEDPALRKSTLVEVLTEVSALYGARSEAYFVCSPSLWKLESIQALYLHLSMHQQSHD